MITNEAEARAYLEALPEWSAEVRERLEALVALLTEENERQNLVAASSIAQVWQRHIADSAQLLEHVPRETSSPWLDLGTGAGFPGLVIAALRPECQVLMVESRARRIDWLERTRITLGLDQAQVLGVRLEAVPDQLVGVISARAFAPLDKLVTLSARFSTSETIWLLPKGRSAAHELESFKGWQHLFHVEHSLTDPEAGVIVGTLQRRSLDKKPRKKG
jgi:16S rRNA (guanine527-N7)-methyltransferase